MLNRIQHGLGKKGMTNIVSGLVGTMAWESGMCWMGGDMHNRKEKLYIEDVL